MFKVEVASSILRKSPETTILADVVLCCAQVDGRYTVLKAQA
jgi:hypothetical protein